MDRKAVCWSVNSTWLLEAQHGSSVSFFQGKHTGSSLAVFMKMSMDCMKVNLKTKVCKSGNYYIMVHKYITCKEIKLDSRQKSQFVTYVLLYQSK